MKRIRITEKQAELLGLNKIAEVKTLKEGVKNIVKISQEQYNRLLASGLIKEGDVVKGGTNRVDKTFKKELGNQGVKPSDLKEGEKEAEDPFKDECIELIKYLYRKSEKLSPFWEQNGLDYDAICDTLLAQKVIVKNGGRYELAKTAGSPEEAIQKVVNTLRNRVKPVVTSEPELETEASGYPAGAQHSSEAPYNQQQQTTTPTAPKQPQLQLVSNNPEIALFKGPDGSLYTFYHYDDTDKSKFADYAERDKTHVGSADGAPDFEYGDFEVDDNVISAYVNDNLGSLSQGVGMDAFEGNVDLVKVDDQLRQDLLHVYDKDKNMVRALSPIQEETPVLPSAHQAAKEKLGAGLPVTPTDPATKPSPTSVIDKLKQLRDKEIARRQGAGEIDETQYFIANDETEKAIAQWIQQELATSPNLTGRQLGQIYNGEFETGYNLQDFDMIIKKYNLKPALGEMTSAASSGAFTAPMGAGVVQRKVAETPVVAEATTTISTGDYQYDTPGLPGIGRNGEFKKAKKTSAESKTQYPNGTFVEFDECVKMNNNKTAQGGGCSTGAVDGVVKQKKSKQSVISPSLDENKIYEQIAAKTGKTVDEVKAIIESKKSKA